MGVIYEIPCECGAVYIGETGRTMKIRKAEHKRAVKNADTTNALALHFIKTGHKILWDECRILEQEISWRKRKTKEVIFIKTTSNTINLDPGFIINPTWTSLLYNIPVRNQ